MTPADLASRVRLLVEALVPPVRGLGEIGNDLPRMLPGQRFMAQILDLLPDGNFRAQSDGRVFSLALPDAASPGETLELIVTARQGSTVQARLATPADLSAATPDTLPDATSRGESRPTLSQTGQLISQLLTGRFGEARPLPLASAGKVLSANPLDTLTTASELRQLVSQSGLFYESHLAEWMGGTRSLASLQSEPQGRFPAANAAAADDAAAGKSATGTASVAQSDASAPDSIETPASARAGAELPATTTSAHALRLPEPLTPVVLQQLDALATHQASWQGQVWPGAQMEWSLLDPDDGRERSEDEEVALWRSHMRLLLPRLGELDARLALGADGARIQLASQDAASAQRLREGLPALREAFEAAGIALLQVTVEDHDAG